MPLMSSYLITTKNVEAFFNSIVGAKAPEVFTNKFLYDLGFKSTNDRLFIGVLKGLGFIEENGAPTQRYYDFLDQGQSKIVLADAIEEAYEDLFNVNVLANTLTIDDVKNKLKTLTQGKHSDRVYKLMANTFNALSGYADWTKEKPAKMAPADKATKDSSATADNLSEKPDDTRASGIIQDEEVNKFGLHYNIQIHLPETRDPAVYDAMFKSIKEHLL